MSYGKIVIDELKLCYAVDKKNLVNLINVEVGYYIDINEYRLFRMINDRFQYYYEIHECGQSVGIFKFGHYTDVEDSVIKAYFRVQNHVLYHKDVLIRLLKFPELLGCAFNNYTSMDIAYDTDLNVPSMIKRLMRNKEVITIINGKCIRNRTSVIDGVFFEYSTSLNRMRYPSITLKQKKAMKNGNEGISIQAYDKKAEIKTQSNKQYIMEYHGNPGKLFRLEVRLRYQELKDYFKKNRIEPLPDIIGDKEVLESLFFDHLNSVIRFRKGRQLLDWKSLLLCTPRG